MTHPLMVIILSQNNIVIPEFFNFTLRNSVICKRGTLEKSFLCFFHFFKKSPLLDYRREEMLMSIGFNLKYSEGYEDLPHWDQFVKVLESARGRKNMFIFRVITALINELDLYEADSFQTLNAIEYWASERLSEKAPAKNRLSIPGKSPPLSDPVNTNMVSTVSVPTKKGTRGG